MAKDKKGAEKESFETFPGQHEGEKVELVFRQHPVVMRKRLIASLVILVIFSLPLSIWPLAKWPWWSLLAGFIVGAVVFLHRFIGWFFSIYIITDERLIQIVQRGFFNRKVVDIPHNKIQSVNYEVKGLQANLFSFGTIIVQTYVGDLELHYIHKPARIHQLMGTQMRNFTPVHPGETPAPLGGED